MEIKDVREYIEKNKDIPEVKDLLKTFKTVTEEDVTLFLDTENGKSLLQKKLDSNVSKAVMTFETNFKEKKLPSLLEEEILKRFPPKTESEKRIADLEQRIKATELEKKIEKLRNVGLKYATEKGVPVELVDNFLGDDEETTVKKLDFVNSILSKYKDELKTEFAKDHGRVPYRKSESDIKTQEMELQEALKTGKMADAIRLRREIAAR